MGKSITTERIPIPRIPSTRASGRKSNGRICFDSGAEVATTVTTGKQLIENRTDTGNKKEGDFTTEENRRSETDTSISTTKPVTAIKYDDQVDRQRVTARRPATQRKVLTPLPEIARSSCQKAMARRPTVSIQSKRNPKSIRMRLSGRGDGSVESGEYTRTITRIDKDVTTKEIVKNQGLVQEKTTESKTTGKGERKGHSVKGTFDDEYKQLTTHATIKEKIENQTASSETDTKREISH